MGNKAQHFNSTEKFVEPKKANKHHDSINKAQVNEDKDEV